MKAKSKTKSAPKTPDAGADTERRAIRQWGQRWAKKQNLSSGDSQSWQKGAWDAIGALNNFLDTRSRRYQAKAGGPVVTAAPSGSTVPRCC